MCFVAFTANVLIPSQHVEMGFQSLTVEFFIKAFIVQIWSFSLPLPISPAGSVYCFILRPA